MVAGETGSGKSTQLPKICLELGRGRAGADRPHPAPPPGGPHRRRPGGRGAGHRGRRPRRLHGPVHRPGRRAHPGQADDRRHPAGRAPARPAAAPLRHAHRRRGPRAQPQHRLPARLPHRPAAPPARPQGDRHLGHHRHRALRRALRRPGGRGVGPHLPGRGALPAPRRATDGGRPTRSTRIRGAVDELRPARGPATSSCSSAASARSATRPRALVRRRACPTPRSCRSTPGCRPPSSSGRSDPTRAGASCWPPTWPRRRSPCPASATSSTPAPPASPATTGAPRCSACPIEPVSQASANQRAGRCGRVAPGICIRLYAEDDFDARPEFTEPEILRTNLASVILQMAALRAGRRRVVPVRRPARRPRHPRRGRPARRAGRRCGRRPLTLTAARAPAGPACRSTPGSGG